MSDQDLPRKESGIIRLLGYALPYKSLILAILLLMIFYSAANSLRLAAVGLVIDGVVSPAEDGQRGRTVTIFEDYILPWIPGGIELPHQSEDIYRIKQARLLGEVQVETGSTSMMLVNGIIVEADLVGGGTLQAVSGTRIEVEGVTAENFRSLTEAELIDYQVQLPTQLSIGTVSESTTLHVYSGTPGSGALQLLWLAAAFIAGLSLVVALCGFYRLILGQKVRIQVVIDIRNALFQHLSRQSLDFYESRRHGDVVSRSVGDVASVSASVQLLFGEFLQSPLTVLFSLSIAAVASWQMTLAILPFFLLLALPVFRQAKRVRTRFRGALSHAGETTEGLSQLFSGIRVVKSFGLEKQHQAQFEKTSQDLQHALVRTEVARAKGRSLVEGLYNLLSAAAIAVGGWVIIQGWLQISFGDFAVFLVAILSCYTPIKNMARMVTTVGESVGASDRIFEVLDTPLTVVDHPESVPMELFSRKIEFEAIRYQYAGQADYALNGVDFSVGKGERVALVGPSGSGKSTIFDVLARFREPTEGRILFDGVDYKNLTHSSLLDQIAIVGQEPFLFHSSVKENIRGGRVEATDLEIENAARAASVHEEIAFLPDGYDTVIGERGDRLSGGQRQRITIARAILKDAPILLLDEATASLDSESEQRVQQALDQLMRDRTVLVVAHRLSTVRDADRVLVLEKGRIVEQGTDDSLRAAGGLYARLSALQETGLAEESQSGRPDSARTLDP
ncbi:MAG: ABC transporter ATP-binding protein [Planctomycetota bacterium]